MKNDVNGRFSAVDELKTFKIAIARNGVDAILIKDTIGSCVLSVRVLLFNGEKFAMVDLTDDVGDNVISWGYFEELVKEIASFSSSSFNVRSAAALATVFVKDNGEN